MASRHHSLNLSEVADVTDLISSFEQHNEVRIEVRMSVVMTTSGPDLQITTVAHDKKKEIGEAAPLASTSAICSATNLKTVMGVLTHAMYTLDFQLVVNELAYQPPKKA